MNVWQTKVCTKSIWFYCFLDWTLLMKRARTSLIFSSPRKTWNGRFGSGSAYLSEFVGRWQLKSTHQKNSLVSMWDAWCILLSDLETMSQCSIDNMHIVQPSGPKDQCFSLKFNQILLAYLFPNTAISVLALMGVVSLHVRCLFAPKFLWWKVTRDCTEKSINISEKLLTTTSDWDFLIYAANLHFRQAIIQVM